MLEMAGTVILAVFYQVQVKSFSDFISFSYYFSGTSIPQCHENERENIEDFGRGGNGQENNANRRGGNIVSGRRIRPRQNNPMRPGRIQRRSFQ